MKSNELPNTIFLHLHGDSDVDNIEDATWSEERKYPTDVEYVRKKSPWISVEEQLPEIVTKDGESDYMLVRYNGCIPVIAKYCTEEYHVCPTFKLGHKIYRSHWITPTFNWLKFNVTHWMPIPTFDENTRSEQGCTGTD